MTPVTDPMEYFRKFGGEDASIGLSVSDSLCGDADDRLCGLLQTQMPDNGRFACAYLNPAEMRELAGELVKLAASIEAHGKHELDREPQPHGPLCASRACGECTCGEFEMQLAAAQTIPAGESRKCAKCGFNISEYAVGEILCGACLNDQPCALCGHRYEAHEPDMQCHDGEAHGNRCACRTFVPSGEKEAK